MGAVLRYPDIIPKYPLGDRLNLICCWEIYVPDFPAHRYVISLARNFGDCIDHFRTDIITVTLDAGSDCNHNVRRRRIKTVLEDGDSPFQYSGRGPSPAGMDGACNVQSTVKQ